MKKNFYQLAIICFMSVLSVGAQQQSKSVFSITARNTTTQLFTDKKDFKVVHIAADIFAKDFLNITGTALEKNPEDIGGETISIIVGTIGYNRYIDQMILMKN